MRRISDDRDKDREKNTVRAVIFGGTSEGRELAEYAAVHRVPVLVSVVSEYGESLLEETAYVRVRQGALDRETMEQLLRQEAPALVLDATHPYASVVSEQVSELCGKLGIPYRRVVREEAAESDSGDGAEGIFKVPSAEAAVALLAGSREPVLLTTGSKELERFASAEHLSGRIYARVLPDSGVLAKCERLGIGGAHLIAMQGPFSVEMNRALLHQTKAGWLVTKESGSRGGFDEKIRAAQECGCRVIVIERPVKETGISLERAKLLLTESGGLAHAEYEQNIEHGGEKAQKTLKESSHRQISLIGMGMGGGSQLTLEALRVLKQCDAVLGAPRMLEDVEYWCRQAEKEPIYKAEEILAWLEDNPQYKHIAVVFSGDTGFYSGSSILAERLRSRCREMHSPDTARAWQIRVYPGISSVSSLCAGMQTTWNDLCLASAHGRNCDVAELIRRHKRLFLLLGGTENLNSICETLCSAGYADTLVTAGVRMGYPDEKFISGTAKELCSTEADELAAVVLERRDSISCGKKHTEVNHER